MRYCFTPVRWIVFAVVICFSESCNEKFVKPDTVAIHNPIYPDSNTPVSFGLFFLNENHSLRKVELNITYRIVNKTSSESDPEIRSYAHEWVKADTFNLPITYNHRIGFPLHSVVTYTFKVSYGSERDSYSHRVTFATKPFYPAEDAEITDEKKQPVPVYATADVNHACNILLIPETDLPDLSRQPGTSHWPYFFQSVRDKIKNGVFLDPAMRKHSGKLNFFINPVNGTFNYSSDRNFVNPVNSLEIVFADASSFIHQTEYDREVTKLETGQFTTRIYHKGYFMHELGHALFNLGDEYEQGTYFPNITKPNNWNDENAARQYARSINVPAKNLVLIQDADLPQNKCYILCPYEGCIMGLGGISIVNYGPCCRAAIDYYMNEYFTP